MNLRSIQYFLITAEEMSFTKAAERLFISQQALSSHIGRLEEEYGVQLFQRRPALQLTQEGKEMLFYSKQILDDEAKMRTAFSDISAHCRGTLKIGLSRLRSAAFFPQIWNYYHPSHPNISMEVIDGNSDKLEELLQAGKIDLYIGIDVPVSPNQHRIQLARETIQCCMAQSLLEQYRKDGWPRLLKDFEAGANLSEILDFPFITLRRSNRLRKALEQFFSHQRRRAYFVFECDQQELIYELTKGGAGAGLLSPVILYQNRREIQALGQAFHTFPVVSGIPENTVWLVYRRDYPLPQYGLDLVQVICMVFHNYTRTITQGI